MSLPGMTVESCSGVKPRANGRVNFIEGSSSILFLGVFSFGVIHPRIRAYQRLSFDSLVLGRDASPGFF